MKIKIVWKVIPIILQVTWRYSNHYNHYYLGEDKSPENEECNNNYCYYKYDNIINNADTVKYFS